MVKPYAVLADRCKSTVSISISIRRSPPSRIRKRNPCRWLSIRGVTHQINDTIHQVLGEGNFVLTVSEGTVGGAPTAFYDLFRVENGKIAEHWDVIETIPALADWKNQNGKFEF
ncbi:nuclear transport factor 2 family protein [Rhizobium leguminosarum]|uniref:nuclear transport factor 2 family protein n=1 Tax=Rhizobium leguminosarum TaxID=384 RepID=UPI0019800BEC|nr:hypothetical protein [Rhizobium leguminosarum]